MNGAGGRSWVETVLLVIPVLAFLAWTSTTDAGVAVTLLAGALTVAVIVGLRLGWRRLSRP